MLGVNTNTVLRALRDEGLLEFRRRCFAGSGLYELVSRIPEDPSVN